MLVHKSHIVSPYGGRVYHLLAALTDIVAVGGGNLLALVPCELDAPPEIGRDGRLIPALSEERIDCLNLVPT